MPSKTSRLKRFIIISIIFLSTMALMLFVLVKVMSSPLPKGTPGAEADALAREMMAASNQEAWQNTGAISWNFDNRQRHLWDRERHMDQVTWGNIRVLVDLPKKTGLAYRKGQRVSDEENQKLVDQAWSFWANDSFWLNPLGKLFDEGTTRSLVDLDGEDRGLLITYSSGGVTPGDSYLWHVGPDGLPKSWRMWVSIIPVKGFNSSWQEWQTLETGAKVCTFHDIRAKKLQLLDVKAAHTLTELLDDKEDPFKPLMGE